MIFDELWRRNLPGMDPGISPIDNQAEASFFCDPAFGKSAFEDLDEAEMNRFLECLERTLMIDDPGEPGA